MSNLTQNQRNQFERASYPGETLGRPRDGSTRGLAITLLVLIVILALLSWALIEAIDGWAHLVVLGDLVILTVAIAFFVRPRKQDEPATKTAPGGHEWRPKKF